MVLPVFNEAGTLQDFFGELISAVEPLGFENEAVFINDGSSDDSLAAMREVKDQYVGRVDILVLDFARNFGHQAAVTAGIEHTTGDVVLIMDTDMQDDPAVMIVHLFGAPDLLELDLPVLDLDAPLHRPGNQCADEQIPVFEDR